MTKAQVQKIIYGGSYKEFWKVESLNAMHWKQEKNSGKC